MIGIQWPMQPIRKKIHVFRQIHRKYFILLIQYYSTEMIQHWTGVVSVNLKKMRISQVLIFYQPFECFMNQLVYAINSFLPKLYSKSFSSQSIFQFFSSMFDKSQKQLLRQQFELVAPNLRMIIQKKAENLNYYERQLLSNVLKKVIFIRESFNTRAANFNKMVLNLQLQAHEINQTVFKKGDKGDYFYIVLEGAYYVEIENSKGNRKEKNIFYYPGDSFGQVSLIYDVPRGATIISNKESSIIKIPKSIFNQCGNLQKSIKYLNNFFQNHTYFEKEDKFMIRIVSSLSKLVEFRQKQVLVQEGQTFSEILFFSKGQANIYKRLKLENKQDVWYETILMGKLSDGDVFGQKYYLQKQPSSVKIVSVTRGEYIKVSFKDNISTIETPLYKRIRQNALRYPSDDELLEQYKAFLVQKCKQLQFLLTLYKTDKNIKDQLKHVKAVYLKVKDSKLAK